MAERMLLSHNFTLADEKGIPPLSREEFYSVFNCPELADVGIEAELIDHPHWSVEVRFDLSRQSPATVGVRCAEALQRLRSGQMANSRDQGAYDILALGGLKETPVTSNNPVALQTGEWGVDMVETADPEAFLAMIGWQRTVMARQADTYFKQAVSVTA